MNRKRNWKKATVMALCLGVFGTGVSVNAEESTGYKVNEQLASEETTLNLYGPGLFATCGEEGSTDLLSGIELPGYDVVINRWNELYPKSKVVIDAIPWDSWQTNITTACMDGKVDIILHGATMTDLTEDLAPYLAKEPEYLEKIYQTASRLTTDNMAEYKVSGISLTVSPAVVWLDKEKFEHYGLDLPNSEWTYDDMLNLAEKMTGIDPVTNEQTYGVQYYAAGENNLWFNQVWWANSLGAEIFEYHTNLNDAVVNYTCEESVQAFQMVADLAQYADPEVREGIAVNTVIDGNNKWGMFVYEGVTNDWNEILAAGLEDRYVCINLPICTKGRWEGLPIPHAGENNLAIYKESVNKELAWEFIKFMTTDEVAVKWTADQLAIPNSAEGMKYVKEHLPEHVVKVLDYVLSSIPENYNNSTTPVWNNVSFGATTNSLITAVDNVINGHMSAEEAAQYMQDYVDEYLASGVAE